MEPTHNPITVVATVNAPVEKAWQIFTEPAHIIKWNSASPDWHTPRAENDLREGGRFSYRMEAKDGSMGFDFGGVYTSVNPHSSFSYIMDDGRKALVKFSGSGSGTIVETIFEPEATNPVEFQQAGWQSILDNYKQYTNAN